MADPTDRDMGTLVGQAAEVVRRRLGNLQPTIAIVLGSGLGALAEVVHSAFRIPHSEIPGFPPASAPGHLKHGGPGGRKTGGAGPH